MREGKTWFRLYLEMTQTLGIIFPLKQSELTLRQNYVPDDIIVYHKRNATKEEIKAELDAIGKIYFKLYKTLTSEKFYEYLNTKDIMKEHCIEYPDRVINMTTILSCWYMSGYKGTALYNKAYEWLTGIKL